MSKKASLIALLSAALLLAACKTTPGPTPSPQAVSSPTRPAATEQPVTLVESDGQIRISELLPGAPGNNNLEFIELYNAGSRPVDLNGWSLWYQMNSSQPEKLVYRWEGPAGVPGYGHYLLARPERDVGLTADAEYDVPLFERKGGLLLRDAENQTVDALGWGDAPAEFSAGSPAPAPAAGESLERLPGGDAGNGADSGDNAADFVANPAPNPQNSGSDITPIPRGRLVISLRLPETVEPGSQLEAEVEVTSLVGTATHGLRVSLPVPEGFEVAAVPAGATLSKGRVEWEIDELADGESRTMTVSLSSPWTYLITRFHDYTAEAADWPLRAYGAPTTLTIAGGSIPIATARTLVGKVVTVEGTATMYTGAFYAGSTGTKFYLEDETGGIQVYCPGGMGIVEVGLGNQVRVTGEIDVYRSSVEIIPDDVSVLEHGAAEWEPTAITLRAAGTDESVLGRLVVVEGTATRIEEFSYSYEVDLTDDTGDTQLVYIEKETGISVEPLDTGRSYRVTGISEQYDGTWQLKPRLQADLAPVFAPELMLAMTARNSVPPGGAITYTLTAYNHTEAPLTNVRVVAPLPTEGVAGVQVLDGGEQEGEAAAWIIPELAAGGGSQAVRYVASVGEGASGQIIAPPALASADEWPDPVASGTSPMLTFVGGGVPIWAIQGAGSESPYVRGQATTEGVITGVFPELEGFWIQEAETDQDPATSAGLFVLTGDLEIPVEAGDLVRVAGKVREKSGQTLLHLLALEDLVLVSSGNQLPPAVELDPPREEEEAAHYWEALEGVLVRVSGPAVAVAPTTKYGETVLVRSEWGIDRVMRGDPKGLLIFVDDGSAVTHYDLSLLPFSIQTGDSVTGLIGPLAYTYDNYKIEPVAAPAITPSDWPLPALEPAGAASLSVATFNVENLFDFQDPHPSDPPKPSVRAYKLDLAKTAGAILAMGAPTVVGLQEVEHIGILEAVAEQDAIAQYSYQPALIEGTDSRGIDVGYLVRSDRATLAGAAAYPAPEGLTGRPPLLITITVHLESGDATVYLLNNHFTSLSGGEEATEPRRTAQAEWNVTLVEQILAREPDAYVVVLGDLNSFYGTRPLEALREAGLRHVYEFVEPERPYTYIFQGESETLDHMLVTPSLYARLAAVEALHINADYPPPVPEDPSPRRVSDHDPLVAVFNFE